jgi:hypothetical protein
MIYNETNERLLDTAICLEQVPPENTKQEVLPHASFLETASQ